MNKKTIVFLGSFLVHILLFNVANIVETKAQALQDYEVQVRDLERFANSYFAAYTNLFSSNFGFSLNQGWQGGAIPKNAGNISISLVGSSAIIPINDRNRYILANELYQSDNISISPITPGMFTDAKGGMARLYLLDPTTNNRLVDPRNGAYISADFNLIDGIGTEVGVTPFLMPQISVSLGRSTEVSLRVTPVALGGDNGKVNISALGGAIRHDLSQWLTDAEHPEFTVNILMSYMRNKVKFTPNGDKFLTFNNDYLSTEGTNIVLSHRTETQQALLFFNYRVHPFMEIYGHGGIVRQVSNLGSDGVFRLKINNEFVRDVVDDSSLSYTDLFNERMEKTRAAGGFGVILGSGFLKTELQYTYANTHIASLALRANILSSGK